MKRQNVSSSEPVRALAIALVVISSLALLGGCGGNTQGNTSLEIDCSKLGGLPTTSGTMNGYFTFGGTSRYPLSIDLKIDQRTFSGTARIQDSTSSYSGTCSGSWTTAGALSGTCTLSGTTTLSIKLSGTIGESGGCGTWSNQAFQDGEWRLGR